MKILSAFSHRMNNADPEENGWHPEDIATAVLVGFLSAVTLIALI